MALAATAAAPAFGQEPGDEGPSRVRMVGEDIKLYVTAPLRAERQQWVRFGVALGAVALAYQYDDDVREHFGTVTQPPGIEPDTYDTRDAVPAALVVGGTWVAAVVIDEDAGRREAGAMLEAAALSGVTAYALKEISDRDRPFATEDRSSFGGDGDSFPSLHTTTAFAIGTVLAESGNDRQRWLRRVLGYGIAAHTAYARLDHDAHWLSDTVAGAALGIATARFVMKRRAEGPQRARFDVVPTPGGVQLSYTVLLRE
jgi:membrane-associated phospholipid phosphatase